MSIDGFKPFDSQKEANNSFMDALEKYDTNRNNETIQAFLHYYKNKRLDEVEVLGVMLTGQTKNYKALENQEFIRGASVGDVAEIVPYIKPEK